MQDIRKLRGSLRSGVYVDAAVWELKLRKASHHKPRRHKMSKEEFVQRMLQDRADADA